MVWQDVETEHFQLFFKILGSPSSEIASMVYHSTESFEARQRMLGRVADVFMKDKSYKDFRKQWNGVDGGLVKRLNDANRNRNKLAHYREESDQSDPQFHSDGSVSFMIDPPRLRPSPYNMVSRQIGYTPEDPAHNLSVEDIRGYRATFRQLLLDLEGFRTKLPVPEQPGSNLLQQIGLPPRHILKRSPSPMKSSRTDGEPSDQ